jgi:hypothetical protein
VTDSPHKKPRIETPKSKKTDEFINLIINGKSIDIDVKTGSQKINAITSNSEIYVSIPCILLDNFILLFDKNINDFIRSNVENPNEYKAEIEKIITKTSSESEENKIVFLNFLECRKSTSNAEFNKSILNTGKSIPRISLTNFIEGCIIYDLYTRQANNQTIDNSLFIYLGDDQPLVALHLQGAINSKIKGINVGKVDLI